MSNNTIDSSLANSIQELGLNRVEEQKNGNDLGQDEFLELMVTQLRNQDPFKPMENGDFIAQMAQFSSVSGLQSLQNSFSQLAASLQSNQALQASTMVGRSVLVPSNTAVLNSNSPVTGVLDLPTNSNSVALSIVDSSGQVVRQIRLGPQAAGEVPFTWDGMNDSGTVMPPGKYGLLAKAQGPDGTFSLNTLIRASVESVTLSPNQQGISLNLTDVGSISFSDVREIQ